LTPRRIVAKPTQLEAVEDDPLGPLGASATNNDGALPPLAPPVPPSKEHQLPLRATLPSGGASVPAGAAKKPVDPHRLFDDDEDSQGQPTGPRQPPPVPPAQPSSVRSSVQPSVSVEQASKPTFHITVGDPHKVGDLTSSHIVYSVRTKVWFPWGTIMSPLYCAQGPSNLEETANTVLSPVDNVQGIQAVGI